MAAEGVISNTGNFISDLYKEFILQLGYFGKFVNVFLLVFLVVLYSVFIWKLYRFIAKKDFLGLNLNQYNKSNNAFLTKLFTTLFFLLEYILISPFLIFFWFSAFTIFLIFLTEGHTIASLLLISTVVISAIRMTSYYSYDLSKDLAKLLPFTLLAISMINPNFFDTQRIFTQLNEIPLFLDNILFYLIFIIGLEILLRFFDFIISLFTSEEED